MRNIFGKALWAVVIAVFLALTTATYGLAEEKKVEINTSYSTKQILTSFTGQRVVLKTDAGDVEGTVTSVGDHVVHISKLTGKDFYDAVVVIEKISSVVFRARGN